MAAFFYFKNYRKEAFFTFFVVLGNIFNPIIKSYRYKYVEKLYFSTNISGHWPEWLRNEVIKELNKGNRGTQIVKNILENYNIRIGMEGIRRLNLKNEENSLFRH